MIIASRRTEPIDLRCRRGLRRIESYTTPKLHGAPKPSRSPELNPVENIWQYMRANGFSNNAFDACGDIIDAACQA